LTVKGKKLDYKWVALSNTTLGVLLATIDGSIVLIAMPDIFRGIHLDPLQPGNSFYLLWMILGFLVVSSVLVVSLGRLGDQFGRVRMYNVGFVVYTMASLLLTIDWLQGRPGADWLIAFRIVQGIGAAFLVANSVAILTDAFPANQRGLALGINNVVGISGMFIGLVLGGVLAPISWRLVFLVSVPTGIAGTIWSYRSLREIGVRTRDPIDWLGNLTFAAGLVLVMVGITYGIRPYRSHPMGWTSPTVEACISAGVALLALFVFVELRSKAPMFRIGLFRIRAFTFGVLSSFLSAISRGGLMFMLIIWLQGIWLPEHGVDFASTPLWAGIRMLPLTVGFLIAGPISGILSDRYGSRPFATGGMLVSALSFLLLAMLPVNFSYPELAAILLLMGLSMGAFASPNRAGVMNSLPAQHRGAGGGMNQTFQNSAQVLSIGIFFTLMIVGLSATLPHSLATGLRAHGVSAATATRVSHLPPVSVLFAAFLGYNPAQKLLGPHVLARLPAHDAAAIRGRSFFPHLIAGPFSDGLHEAFAFAIAACLVAALASWSRGGRVVAPADHALERPAELGD
jgi:MFS family permease